MSYGDYQEQPSGNQFFVALLIAGGLLAALALLVAVAGAGYFFIRAIPSPAGAVPGTAAVTAGMAPATANDPAAAATPTATPPAAPGVVQPGDPDHFDFAPVRTAQRHLQDSLKDPALTVVELRKPEELTLDNLPGGPVTVVRVVAKDGKGEKTAYWFALRGGDVVRHFAEDSPAEADRQLLRDIKAALK